MQTKTRVLITVTTYPLPSVSYDELVCTAGVLEDGSWIRIYPVPFKFLEYQKWDWVELELIRHDSSKDFRPESHRPRHPALNDLAVIRRVETQQCWYERKQACLKKVYTNLSALIQDSMAPENVSLAVFRPKRLIKFVVKEDDREWKQKWLDQLRQADLFTRGLHADDAPRVPIEKIPYKFKYKLEDDAGKVSTMTIQDWEIGALYRNCLAAAEGCESIAIEKVRLKYEKDFMQNKEISLFLGTTFKQHHARRNNPFTIIGVFYPPRQRQAELL